MLYTSITSINIRSSQKRLEAKPCLQFSIQMGMSGGWNQDSAIFNTFNILYRVYNYQDSASDWMLFIWDQVLTQCGGRAQSSRPHNRNRRRSSRRRSRRRPRWREKGWTWIWEILKGWFDFWDNFSGNDLNPDLGWFVAVAGRLTEVGFDEISKLTNISWNLKIGSAWL